MKKVLAFVFCCSVLTTGVVYGGDPPPELMQRISEFTASGEIDPGFGTSIALSGNTAFVGSPFDDEVASNAGAVYIFEQDLENPCKWIEAGKLFADDFNIDDRFGISVALEGDTALVGSDTANGSGAAYVFYRNEGGVGQWGQVKKLIPNVVVAGDRFGAAVALDGTTALVGAPDVDIVATNPGAAYFFERDEGGLNHWGQVKKLIPFDSAISDNFGAAVTFDGDTALIGAPGDDDRRGASYVFYRDEGGTGNWGEIKKLTPNDPAVNDLFGSAAALSGDIALIGAPGNDVGGPAGGAAYIFKRNEGGLDRWWQVQRLTADEPTQYAVFGEAVGIQGNRVLSYAGIRSSTTSVLTGTIFVFAEDEGGPSNWGQSTILRGKELPSDLFGRRFAVDGSTLLAVSQGTDSVHFLSSFLLFCDGLESGDTTEWSEAIP